MQALVEQPPVHPNDVLREIVELAQLPMSQIPYEDDPQFGSQLDGAEDADLLGSERVGDNDLDPSDEQQGPEPSAQASQPQPGAAWSDNSFTDAALDDDTFDTSGFDVVEQT